MPSDHCPYLVTCPWFGSFRSDLALHALQERFCRGDYNACSRFRLAAGGSMPTPALSPGTPPPFGSPVPHPYQLAFADPLGGTAGVVTGPGLAVTDEVDAASAACRAARDHCERPGNPGEPSRCFGYMRRNDPRSFCCVSVVQGADARGKRTMDPCVNGDERVLDPADSVSDIPFDLDGMEEVSWFGSLDKMLDASGLWSTSGTETIE